MTAREASFALILAVASALIAVGAFRIADSVGYIVTGVLLGVWAWLVFAEVES